MTKTADETRYMPRIIDGAIAESLSGIGAVSIEGPAGCGKTTTAERVCKSALYLEDPSEGLSSRRFAETFPDVVLDGPVPRLIDEWEHVPELWDSARCEIDRRGECGQFVLTQSMYPLHLSRSHPGTGRIARFRMRTMSLYETGDSSGEVSLEKLCDGETESLLTRRATPDDIMRYILRGGWPEAVASGSDGGGVAKRIVYDALRSCGQNLDGVRYSRANTELVLRSLAWHEGVPASAASIASDVFDDGDPAAGAFAKSSVNRGSATRYMDFLERLYLMEDVPPFRPRRCDLPGARMRREKKRRLCDVSLACACLGLTKEALTGDYDMFSRLFCSLVVHDLRVYAESFGAYVSYYRDYEGRGIDAVIELPDGRWCAFDAVPGNMRLDEECGRLRKTCAAIERAGMVPPSSMCVVSGTSGAAYRRDDGVSVVPLTALRP